MTDTLLCAAGCGRPYSKGPDLVVSDADWAKIAPRPDGGGVLCPNCMHDRFVAAGAADGSVSAKFTSGPFALLPAPECRAGAWANEIEVANKLDNLIDELFTSNAATAEAAIRELLWDNKIGFIRLAQSLSASPPSAERVWKDALNLMQQIADDWHEAGDTRARDAAEYLIAAVKGQSAAPLVAEPGE